MVDPVIDREAINTRLGCLNYSGDRHVVTFRLTLDACLSLGLELGVRIGVGVRVGVRVGVKVMVRVNLYLKPNTNK